MPLLGTTNNCLLQAPARNKKSNWTCTGARVLCGSQINTVSTLQMMWDPKKTQWGLSRPEVLAGQWGSQWVRDRFRMRVRALLHAISHLSLKAFTKWVSSHHDWLGGKCPKLFPLRKQRKIASFKQLDCCMSVRIWSIASILFPTPCTVPRSLHTALLEPASSVYFVALRLCKFKLWMNYCIWYNCNNKSNWWKRLLRSSVETGWVMLRAVKYVMNICD